MIDDLQLHPSQVSEIYRRLDFASKLLRSVHSSMQRYTVNRSLGKPQPHGGLSDYVTDGQYVPMMTDTIGKTWPHDFVHAGPSARGKKLDGEIFTWATTPRIGFSRLGQPEGALTLVMRRKQRDFVAFIYNPLQGTIIRAHHLGGATEEKIGEGFTPFKPLRDERTPDSPSRLVLVHQTQQTKSATTVSRVLEEAGLEVQEGNDLMLDAVKVAKGYATGAAIIEPTIIEVTALRLLANSTGLHMTKTDPRTNTRLIYQRGRSARFLRSMRMLNETGGLEPPSTHLV